ncbi:hypothetical protein [Micromonospora sp. NPDC049102]|uniref:restriction system modified-DNA reader domain-containing protein n=1 Tax=Micromonospora sp. NPDC049102 TaxID=3364265 RepID=UPI0037208F7D
MADTAPREFAARCQPVQRVDGGTDGTGDFESVVPPSPERGDLKVGEHLYWLRPRLRQRFIATVLASGELEVEGCRYRSPSDAATACAGSPANGWTAWRLEDGTLLDKLRP